MTTDKSDSMTAPAPKKPRRPNFTESELLTMVEEAIKRAEVITGKLDNRITARVKALAWEEVTQGVNTVAKVRRTPDEVRLKFKDFKSAVKKKAAQDTNHMEGTGKKRKRPTVHISSLATFSKVAEKN